MLKWLNQWLKDNFGFSKAEANGSIILIFIILVVAIIPRIIINKVFSDPISFQQDQELLNDWGKQLEDQIKKKNQADVPENELANDNYAEPENFRFNPNSVTQDQLISLGFKPFIHDNIQNYLNAGGSFKEKKDLLKIYGISTDRVHELWNYIDLPEEVKKAESKELKKYKKSENERVTPEIIRFDINLATAEQLQQIRGIGPGYSKRIIDYRNKLGGFISPDQLFEVWGLNETVIEGLLEYAFFQVSPQKININTDTLKHLYAHPYIDYNTARAIMNYRKQRGQLDSISELKEIKIISDSLYQKIYPYLSSE